MQVRRWWKLNPSWAVPAALLVQATLVNLRAHALSVPADGSPESAVRAYVEKQADDLKTAVTTSGALTAREAALLPIRASGGPVAANWRYAYSRVLVEVFRKLLSKDVDAKVQLHAIIALADPDVDAKASQDRALVQALETSTNPAVRYWAATGLQNAIPGLAGLPSDAGNAIKSVQSAVQKEDSPVALAAMYGALRNAALAWPQTDIYPTIATGFSRQADSLKQHGYTRAQASAAIAGMQAVIDVQVKGQKPNPDEVTALLTSALTVASYAAEQDLHSKAVLTDPADSEIVRLMDQLNTFVPDLASVGGGSFVVPKGAPANDVYVNLGTAIRALNKSNPNVPIPTPLFK